MPTLEDNRWGKSEVRVSKVHRGPGSDDFSDVTVQVLLRGGVEAAYVEGDNSAVLPTDTMRNTVYGLAQEHLTKDLERFGETLCDHFLDHDDVHRAAVRVQERRWERVSCNGFIGGGSERRTARVIRGEGDTGTWAGIEGMVVLKTGGSAFAGFPEDAFTILAEADDRLLATSVTSEWRYSRLPGDPSRVWSDVRRVVVDHFFGDWSASVQHQGWLMATAVLEAVPEIEEIRFHLPNQHHLHYDLTRFGMADEGIVFHPVSEPYGDIAFTVTR